MLFDFEFTKTSLRRLLVILVAVAMIFSQFAVIGYADDGFDQEYTNEGSASGDAEETVESVDPAETVEPAEPVEPVYTDLRSVSGNSGDDIIEIRFETPEPITVYKGGRGWEYYVGNRRYSCGPGFEFSEGCKLFVTTDNGTMEYTYSYDVPTGFSEDGRGFVDSSGEFVYLEDLEVTCGNFSDWEVGEEHSFTLHYFHRLPPNLYMKIIIINITDYHFTHE